MSQENVELVQRSIASANTGDWESAFRDGASNFELDWSRAQGLLRGVYRGEEAQRLLIDSLDGWQSVRFEPHEFIEVGEHVVVPWTMHFVAQLA